MFPSSATKRLSNSSINNPDGATVDYDLPDVTDNVDPNPSISCEPTSGEQFPIGTTEVTCTASDESGNTSTITFNVTVNEIPPPPLVELTCGDGTIQQENECVVDPEITQQISDLESDLAIAQSDLAMCNDNLTTVNEELAACNDVNTQLQSDIANLNNVVIPGLEAAIAEKMTTISNLESQIASLNEQITMLQNDNALLEQMKAQLESDLLDAQTTIAQLESIILGETDAEICHKPGKSNQSTMLVNIQQLQGHLKHGDILGACE